MVPNWSGINDIAIEKAKRIAGKDYVILLTDMYGEGVRPKNAEEAQAAVKPLYADRNLMRARIRKAFAELEAQATRAPRSEEHTSELQSLMRNSYAVFCLQKNKQT